MKLSFAYLLVLAIIALAVSEVMLLSFSFNSSLFYILLTGSNKQFRNHKHWIFSGFETNQILGAKVYFWRKNVLLNGFFWRNMLIVSCVIKHYRQIIFFQFLTLNLCAFWSRIGSRVLPSNPSASALLGIFVLDTWKTHRTFWKKLPLVQVTKPK